MRKARRLFAAATMAMLFGASPALAEEGAQAEPVEGEFGNECVMGLALGKDVHTDCSVNTVYKGKTYCFGNETAKTLFLKRPDDFLLQAQVYYSSKQDAEQE